MIKRVSIFISLFLISIPLYSQWDIRIDESLKKVTPLNDGSYSIEHYTNDTITAIRGFLSQTNPEVRHGKFEFYNEDGKTLVSGEYFEDVPIGEWIYLDDSEDTLIVIDYNPVWDYLDREAMGVDYDLSTLDSLKRKEKRSMFSDGTFSVVEEMPTFNGGDPQFEFSRHVREELITPIWPSLFLTGRSVSTRFLIDTEGMVHSPNIITSYSPDLAIEALRILYESPPWEPGKINGFPVNVWQNWNFVFAKQHLTRIQSDSQSDSIYLPEFDDAVFYIVEEMPLFNGGDPALEFRKFIAQNLQYPISAAENGEQGRVIVQFAVNPYGEVENAIIVRSVTPALDREAIRVVTSSPPWTPGKQRGENVTVIFTFPINFVLGK